MVYTLTATISSDTESEGNILVTIVDDYLDYTKEFTLNGYNQTQNTTVSYYINGEVNNNAFQCYLTNKYLQVDFYNKSNDIIVVSKFTATDSADRVLFASVAVEKTLSQNKIEKSTEGDLTTFSFYDDEDNTYYGEITYDPNANSYTATNDTSEKYNYQNLAVLASGGLVNSYLQEDQDKNINKTMSILLMAVSNKSSYLK